MFSERIAPGSWLQGGGSGAPSGQGGAAGRLASDSSQGVFPGEGELRVRVEMPTSGRALRARATKSPAPCAGAESGDLTASRGKTDMVQIKTVCSCSRSQNGTLKQVHLLSSLLEFIFCLLKLKFAPQPVWLSG